MEENPVLLAERRLLNALWWNPNFYDDPLYDDSVWVHDSCRSMAKALDNLSKNPNVVLSKLAWYNEALKYSPEVSQDMTDFVINLAGEGETTSITDIVSYLKDYRKIQSASENLDNIKKVLTSVNVITKANKDEIRKEIEQIEEKVLSNENSVINVMDIDEWGNKWEEEFNERIHGKKYCFNDAILDKMIVDGPMPGAGTLLVAAPGMGKSAMCLRLANNFINSGIPCIFFSLEMSAVSTYDRLISLRLQIPYTDIVNPSDEGTFYSIKEKVEEERKRLSENKNFRFCEDPNISLKDIEKHIIKFQEQIGQTYCIVILDLITMVQDLCNVKGGSLAQTIELGINAANALSKRLNCHYIGTCQLNRENEKGNVTDPEDLDRVFSPRRSQVKNSSALIERCRGCISLYRRKFYMAQCFPDDQELLDSEQDIVSLKVLKLNNGSTEKTYKMLFNPEVFTLTPIEDSEDDSFSDDDCFASTIQ